MKSLTPLTLAALALLLLSSCGSSRQASGTSYEDDEIYYRKGETFITEVPPAPVASQQSTTEEEYYNPESTGSGTTNNYYGDVYFNQNDWDRGFGGGYFDVHPRWVMAWNPNMSWYLSYNFGMNSCFGNGFNSFYDPFYLNNPWYQGNGWGNGWGNNFCFNGGMNYWNPYGYWNNPYLNGWGNGYNTPWWGAGFGNEENGQNAVVFGPRSPISSSSVFSSSYNDESLFEGKVSKPIPGVTLDNDVQGNQSAMRVPTSNEMPSRFSTTQSELNRVPANRNPADSRTPGDDYMSSPQREGQTSSPAVTPPADRPAAPSRNTGRQNDSKPPRTDDSDRRPSSGFNNPSSGGSNNSGSRSSGSGNRSGGSGSTRRK